MRRRAPQAQAAVAAKALLEYRQGLDPSAEAPSLAKAVPAKAFTMPPKPPPVKTPRGTESTQQVEPAESTLSGKAPQRKAMAPAKSPFPAKTAPPKKGGSFGTARRGPTWKEAQVPSKTVRSRGRPPQAVAEDTELSFQTPRDESTSSLRKATPPVDTISSGAESVAAEEDMTEPLSVSFLQAAAGMVAEDDTTAGPITAEDDSDSVAFSSATEAVPEAACPQNQSFSAPEAEEQIDVACPQNQSFVAPEAEEQIDAACPQNQECLSPEEDEKIDGSIPSSKQKPGMGEEDLSTANLLQGHERRLRQRARTDSALTYKEREQARPAAVTHKSTRLYAPTKEKKALIGEWQRARDKKLAKPKVRSPERHPLDEHDEGLDGTPEKGEENGSSPAQPWQQRWRRQDSDLNDSRTEMELNAGSVLVGLDAEEQGAEEQEQEGEHTGLQELPAAPSSTKHAGDASTLTVNFTGSGQVAQEEPQNTHSSSENSKVGVQSPGRSSQGRMVQEEPQNAHSNSENSNVCVPSPGGSRHDSVNSSNGASPNRVNSSNGVLSPNHSSPDSNKWLSSTLPPANTHTATTTMPALQEIHERINLCSARLCADAAGSASSHAANGADHENDSAAKAEAWKEVEWLRQAVVGMHSHLMLVQQRQKSFEKECQNFQTQVEKAGVSAPSSFVTAPSSFVVPPGSSVQLRPQMSVSPIRRVVSAGTVSSIVHPASTTVPAAAVPLGSPSVPQLWGAFPAPCSAAPQVIVKTAAPSVTLTPRSRSHERMGVARSRQASQSTPVRPDPLSRTQTPRSVHAPSRSSTPSRHVQDSNIPAVIASPRLGASWVAAPALPGGFIHSPAQRFARDGTASVPAPMRTSSVPRSPRGYPCAAKQSAPAAPLAIPWQFSGAASMSGLSSPTSLLSPSMPVYAHVNSAPH